MLDGMIYCVVTAELADELGDRLVEYYRDNPGVEVIVERRQGSEHDRRKGSTGVVDDRRVQRDRRRPRAMGTFPPIEALE